MIRIIPTCLIIIMSLIIILCSFNKTQEYDVIPDKETAIKVAEVILKKRYGEKNIERQQPFEVYLKNNVWIITGTLKDSSDGGVAYIEIQKLDCKVLKIIHWK